MKVKIVEVTDGSFYGKFLIGTYDVEWQRSAKIQDDPPYATAWKNLLVQEGWHWSGDCFFLQDLSRPYNGSVFGRRPGGYAHYDVDKKGITVCFMYADFLHWIRENAPWEDLEAMPDALRFPPPRDRPEHMNDECWCKTVEAIDV